MASATHFYAQAPAPPACRAAGRRRPFVAASASSNGSAHSQAARAQEQDAASALPRRQLLSTALLAPAVASLAAVLPAAAEDEPAAAAAAPAVAAPAGPTVYTDAEDKFSIEVPAGWVQASGAIGEAGTLTSTQARFSNAAGLRKVVAFLPEGRPGVSVAVTVQFLGADYTKLGSFGTAQDFAEGVVNKMDNSYILRLPEWRRAKEGPLQVARLVDVRDKDRQQYVFTYTVDKEGDALRTVYQAVAIGNNGRYNRFYTVNASCTDADLAEFGPVLRRVVDSFKPPAV